MIKQNKSILAIVLTVVLLLAMPLTSFAGNGKKKDKIVSVNNNPAVTHEATFSVDNSDKGEVSASFSMPAFMTVDSGLDLSYWLSKKVYAYGWTDVTAVIPGVDVSAKIRNSVLFYKNEHLFNRKDQTKTGLDPYLKTSTPPDYSPKSGNSYEVQCFHTVWDQTTGSVQLDTMTEDSATY